MRELALQNCRVDKRYDTRELLGRGSYAEVFLARDILASEKSTHKLVVIKCLNVFLHDDLDPDLERTLVENFQNEAVALDRVRHPNIISRLGHGTARDLAGTVFHYLVLEYMAGGDLQSRIRRQKLDLKCALDYIEQTCAGLSHAHDRGIIHRDIKPQNLLLTVDEATVKIADFGVARFSMADSPITRVGTNIYAPPEHSPLHAGKGNGLGKLTPASDIYSLAKTCYTLITGDPPRAFANARIESLPDSIKDGSWADLLLPALQKATQEDALARQQTVDEFWADLAELREFAADGELSTVVRSLNEAPQAHVSRGYTPIAPAKPEFEEAHEPTPVSIRPAYAAAATAAAASPPHVVNGGEPDQPMAARTSPYIDRVTRDTKAAAYPPQKKRTRVRRFITFAVCIIIFTGILYGTASYMRGRLTLPIFAKVQTATANTDIYLRPDPSTSNDPIGLVTKNSKVKIVTAKDNWYQVDIVEQGRPRQGANTVTRGWLNGKYIDIDQN
ncbi:MAG: protein kinase domain-containing protein [Pyrinomonadaceae bacterium]